MIDPSFFDYFMFFLVFILLFQSTAYERVERWDKNFSPVNTPYLFFPINERGHWSLAVVLFGFVLEDFQVVGFDFKEEEVESKNEMKKEREIRMGYQNYLSQPAILFFV